MARTPDGKYGINVRGAAVRSCCSTLICPQLRALQDLDIESLPVLTSDGAATEPRYEVPEPVALQHPGDESNVYQGSCHCGAVGYAVLSPEKITTVKSCNCSICSRVCPLSFYLDRTRLTTIPTGRSTLDLPAHDYRHLQGARLLGGVHIREPDHVS
jgi:hypothetical protein